MNHSMTITETCPRCGAVDEPIGMYYHRKYCDRSSLLQQIADEKSKPEPDPRRLRELSRALELAEYVGD